MKKFFSQLLFLIKKSFGHWNKHNAARMGAAVAYYTVFSIVPILIVLLAIARTFFGNATAQAALLHQINAIIGPTASQFIVSSLQTNAYQSFGLASTIITIATLLYGTIGALNELDSDMNELWEIPPLPKVNQSMKDKIKIFIKQKLIIFSVIPLLAALLIVSISVSIILSVIPTIGSLLKTIQPVIAFVIITLVFASVYKLMAKKKLAWKEVLLGGIITTLFFYIGKVLITLYLERIATLSIYGAAGSLAALLIWVYYSVQIFFIGASFSFIYSKQKGRLSNEIN